MVVFTDSTDVVVLDILADIADLLEEDAAILLLEADAAIADAETDAAAADADADALLAANSDFLDCSSCLLRASCLP